MNYFKGNPKKIEVVKSTYTRDYIDFPDIHCGMGKKPLTAYDPNCFRSRVKKEEELVGMKNREYISIGDVNLINSKQWCSCYKDNFRWPRISLVSHPGINSELARQSHLKLNGF